MLRRCKDDTPSSELQMILKHSSACGSKTQTNDFVTLLFCGLKLYTFRLEIHW